MEFVTGLKESECDDMVKVVDNVNNNQVTKSKFNLDEEVNEILANISLDSKFAVFSGLYLIELYYNSLYNLSTPEDQLPRPIEIYLFGPAKTVNQKSYIILKEITSMKNFGVTHVQNVPDDQNDYIEVIINKYAKPIRIYCVSNCETLDELIHSFDCSNSMIYWAHDTGLVINPFAQLAFKMNDAMTNYKTNQSISNQTLFRLKYMGFDIDGYISTFRFSVDFPKIFKYVNYNSYNINKHYHYFWNHLYKFKMQPGEPDNFTFFDKLENRIEIEKNNSDYLKKIHEKAYRNKSIIALNVECKRVFCHDDGIYLALFVNDNFMAYQIKLLIKYCICQIEATGVSSIDRISCLIPTNYLDEEEKKFYVSSNKIISYLPDYSKENRLGFLSKIDETINIVDTIGKKIILGNNTSTTMRNLNIGEILKDKEMIIWSEFYLKYSNTNILNDTKFIAL